MNVRQKRRRNQRTYLVRARVARSHEKQLTWEEVFKSAGERVCNCIRRLAQIMRDAR